ncbi:MAG: hypothetical protein R3E01_04425 [Pirellulaceae bacterium]
MNACKYALMSLLTIAGCDSIPRTVVVVEDQAATGEVENHTSKVDSVVREIATKFGMQEVQRDAIDVTFSDKIAGQVPWIYIKWRSGGFPVTIEVGEKYASYRGPKHRECVDALVEAMRAEGFEPVVAKQSADHPSSFWIVGTCTILAIFALILARHLLITRRRPSGGSN